MTSFEKSVSLERLDVLYDYIKRVRDDLKDIAGFVSNNQLEIYQDLHKAMIYVDDAANRLRFESTVGVYKAGTAVPKREVLICEVCGKECDREELTIEHLIDNVWFGVCNRCSRVTPEKVYKHKVLSDAEKKRMLELIGKINARR